MNAYLRQKEIKNPHMDLLVRTLNSALSKFPNYQGFVKRGTELPADVLGQHTKGAVVTYDSFTSTSTGPGHYNIHDFMIFSRTGKPIMSLSKFDDEKEVLFLSGTQFKVLDRFEQGPRTIFIMKEVLPGDQPKAEAELEAKILKKIQPLKGKQHSYLEADSWSCPIDPATKPKFIKQKFEPGY